ncbi:hypothetical protein MRX96_033510 [Rhipicephalus microplus]
MADGKERRRKSPEGREKKREGHDRGSDEEKHQLSPTKSVSPFARAERASRSPGSQHASSKSPSSSSRSSSKSPMRQMGTAVLDALKRTPSPRDLCCGTSSEKEEADPSRSSVRRKASSLSKASSPIECLLAGTIRDSQEVVPPSEVSVAAAQVSRGFLYAVGQSAYDRGTRDDAIPRCRHQGRPPVAAKPTVPLK